ncbi:MAG TPA: DUF5682 family protein [Anaerolineae bacterium]|nr:DUF5682 family protein [Anaerolineae bacterium]
MIVFPVRHHSPTGALRLAERIRAARPRLILVEGPSDATPLIPLLLAADTRPPAAILAYFPADRLAEGEEPRSSAWPFCAYSPEYVALQVGREVGATLRFFDMPAGAFLDAPQAANAPQDASPNVWQAIAARFGFDDYEEFWECRFEMADGDLQEAMFELGALVRECGGEAHNAEREAWMRAEIARALAEGYDLADVLIVCGAAHAPALVPPFSPTDGHPRTEARSAQLTLVPFSYPRLSEQLGYGAGNRAPAYYQMVWEQGGDFQRATQEALIRTADALHRAGYAVSLADAIEANRLACMLAALRDKPAPGLFEVRDAAQACYGHGGMSVDNVLWPLMVGEAVGSVSAQVERTALQQEFYDTVARLRLPCTDAPQERRLHLTQPADIETSIFLHRLIAADIPFGQVEAVQMVGRGKPEADVDDAARWLGQLREKWTLRWTPLTDIRLVEASVEGDSLAQVCTRRFRRALAQARRVADAADVLLRIVLTQIEPLYIEGLVVCECTSSTDDDLPSLARAAYHLHSLVKYGASRAMAAEAIETLLSKVYVRASLLLPGAAAVADEAAPSLRDALITLHDVARRSSALDAAVLASRLRLTAESDGAHPMLAGLACTLLFFGGELPEADLTMLMSRRLSPGEEPLAGAQFIEGLLALNRAILLRNPAVVAWLNTYLQATSAERFVAALPILRRAFADLAPAEVDYLLAMLARLLDLPVEQARAAADPQMTTEEIAAIDAELGDVMRET